MIWMNRTNTLRKLKKQKTQILRKIYLEKCVFRLSDSNILDVGFPIMSSMLFGRFLRFFDKIALPVAFSSVVVLQVRRLFTRRMDTVFIIIAPRLFKPAAGLFFRFVDAFRIVVDQ